MSGANAPVPGGIDYPHVFYAFEYTIVGEGDMSMNFDINFGDGVRHGDNNLTFAQRSGSGHGVFGLPRPDRFVDNGRGHMSASFGLGEWPGTTRPNSNARFELRYTFSSTPITGLPATGQVPLPGTLWLAGLAAGVLGWSRRRRTR